MTDKTFEKYKLIIDEWFVNGFNGLKAYQKYYPNAKDKTAEQRFSKVSSIVKVSEYIETVRSEISERAKMTIDEAFKLLTSMARFDISECYDENGAFRSIHDIPKEARMAIEGMETEEIILDGKTVARIKKIKSSTRRANIIEILKVLGGYEKDNLQKTTIEYFMSMTNEERIARANEIRNQLKNLKK